MSRPNKGFSLPLPACLPPCNGGLGVLSALCGLVLLAGCAIPADTSRRAYEAPTIAAARKLMPGLETADVRMCAGFPSRSLTLENGDEIWTYERSRPRGSVSMSIPTVQMGGTLPGLNGSVGMSSGGYCNTQMRFRGDRLIDLEFAGDNNSTTRINALCVPVVDGCVVYARHPDDRPARVDAVVDRVPPDEVQDEIETPPPAAALSVPPAGAGPASGAAMSGVRPGPDPVPEGGSASLIRPVQTAAVTRE
ncbi:hypothetical protein V8J36_00565 [Frigidibacter sp. MR17.14]|uniref:hypothetical protein n=1 Tax=Frigidibacter sp. MR17.14 TaxID=3126509 RepID=UPI003012BB27